MKKSKVKTIFTVIIFLILLILVSSNTYAGTKPSLSKKVKTLYVGQKFTLKLNNSSKKTYTYWSSTKKAVCTVKKLENNKAEVTANRVGTAYINAKVNGVKYKCKITVKHRKENISDIKVAILVGSWGGHYRNQSMCNACGIKSDIIYSDCNVNDYDGLIVTGGADINPALYGASIRGSYGIDNNLDKIQWCVLKKFVKAKKPVFGICRGVQLINVFFGGTLNQDIPGHMGLNHKVVSSKKSRMYKLYGHSVDVYSSHHQSAKKIGKGLIVTQRSADGTVEALEHKTLPIFGVQWHPDLMGSRGHSIFIYFRKLCYDHQ